MVCPVFSFGGDLHRFINRPASQEEAEDANAGCIFQHLYTYKSCICHFSERKKPALRRCGPDRNAISASFITPDIVNGKSLLDYLIFAFANVPCSHFTLSELRAGLTTSLAVCSPLTKAFFLELLFLRQTFSLLLHTLFPAEDPLTEPSQAHFRQCHFFLLTFFAFSVGVFSRLKEQKKPFCSTSLQVSVYAGSLLQNVFNI